MLGQLPSLKELYIGGMSRVRDVGCDFLGTRPAFPSLRILHFNFMSGWEVWSTNSGDVDATFPCLQELSITNCPNLAKVSLEALHSLRVLKLDASGHVVLISVVDVASSLTSLDIKDISGLTDEVWRFVIEHISEVEVIKINACNEIRYMWGSEAEASKVLVNLRKLVVWHCSKLVSLGEKENDNCWSSLPFVRDLLILNCERMEQCICPNGLEWFSIEGCNSLTSVSFPTGGGQKLRSISIWGCKNILKMEFEGEDKTGALINSNLWMLGFLEIRYWPNLNSINNFICFNYLTDLIIEGCPGMESFPDHELPNLTWLTNLEIKKCTSMDASFPRGLWPPKLRPLEIGGLKKPISEWGPQNFPSSLVELRLYGGPYDDVRNFGQLSHLLPSSLIVLQIKEFEKLESVSMGLQHLTSLHHLSIRKCPNTIDLPDMLLSSLLSLTIEGCPSLINRSSRGGSYWPSISLIPMFDTIE